MNYIVLDAEWNQPLSPSHMKKEPFNLVGEIIQIGAVKLNDLQVVVDKFKIMVQPKYYTKMNRTVKTLTGIDETQLKSGVSFPEAMEEFRNWCGKNFVFLTWGFDDLPIFKNNMQLHNQDLSWLPETYNLQLMFSSQIMGEIRQYALSSALEILKIENNRPAHDALHDAINTAKICTAVNLKKGIAEYSQPILTPQDPPFLDNTYFKYFPSKLIAMKNKNLIYFTCPECGSRLNEINWVNQNGDKKITVAICENHGEFFSRIKFKKLADKSLSATRIIYKSNDELQTYYNAKLLAHTTKKNKTKQLVIT